MMQMSDRAGFAFKAFGFIVILAASAPSVVEIFFGHSFIASPLWIGLTSPIGLTVGVAASSVMVFIAMRYRKGNAALDNASIPRLVIVAGAMWVGLIIALSIIFYKTVPMIGAAIANDEVRIPYTVARVYDGQGSRRRCAGRVVIQNMPYVANSICGVPPAMQAVLQRGSEISANGRGSSWGVFYTSFSLLD